MKKRLLSGLATVAVLPALAFAGAYTQGTSYAYGFTQNFQPASGLSATFNNRYTGDTVGHVRLDGAPGSTITISARATPWSGTCSQCLSTFSCTIAPGTSLYSTAENLMRSAPVGVAISTWRYNSATTCQSLSVSNSSSYIK